MLAFSLILQHKRRHNEAATGIDAKRVKSASSCDQPPEDANGDSMPDAVRNHEVIRTVPAACVISCSGNSCAWISPVCDVVLCC
jgi:hypothetical protein